LDHNASSPLLPEARAAWLDAEERFPGNASSPHRIGARAEHALDNARQRLADFLGCGPAEILWTSGATEACNTVFHHVATTATPDAEVWVGATEHPSVAESARRYFGERVHEIPVGQDGVTRLDELTERVRKRRPVLVALMAANNETGVLQPWREMRDFCVREGIAYFCDATQWCGRLPTRGLGSCAFVAGSAHKFGGPRGVGFLKCSSQPALHPLLSGGGQQESRRAGTENVAGVLAMLAALEWCEQQLVSGGEASRRATRENFEHRLAATIPGVRVNGANAARLWNTVSVVMPEADCRQRWVVKLDKAGFAVSTGSACASGSERPSPVLTAMGLSPAEAGRALRFSAGWLTPAAAWDPLLEAIVRIHREMSPSTDAVPAA
jgi:cysteine desulfurase